MAMLMPRDVKVDISHLFCRQHYIQWSISLIGRSKFPVINFASVYACKATIPFFPPLSIRPSFPTTSERVRGAWSLAIIRDNAIYSWQVMNSLEPRRVLQSMSLLWLAEPPFCFLSLAHPLMQSF